MTKHNKLHSALVSLNRFILIFIFISFSLTCCMMLFLNNIERFIGITFTRENITFAARNTFGNVIFLSFIFTLADTFRRKITTDRPVKRIKEAAQRITSGDFSVRIKPVFPFNGDNSFNEIISCFNKMAKELSANETLHSDFIANVSHELKTPMSVIQNYATLLSQPDLSEESRTEYSKAIVASTQKLSSLVTDILKLSKLENQQIFPAYQKYNLSEQLCESLLEFEKIWESKNIDLHIDIEEEITVFSDPQLISIIWNNLLSNAFKFTENGGTVSVTLKKENSKAVVSITDTGCGISPETGKRIFEKFYQGDTSHSSSGNGLGLALVKRIIDITGNSISVESELGKGSTFTLTI